MVTPIKELSVFFPVYNLESQITKTVEKAFEFIPDIATKYEIIVVNDGSTDRTSEVLVNLKQKYKELKIVNHKTNKGYGAALKSGIYNCQYGWICFTDGDGQFDIKDLKKLLEKQKISGADLVIGYYIKRKVSRFKIITSSIWELAVFLLFGLKVKDIDCGFKLFRKKVIATIPKLESERGAFISSEFLIKAKKSGFKIVEVGVSHYPRMDGKGTGRNIGVIINSFKDLFKLWNKLR